MYNYIMPVYHVYIRNLFMSRNCSVEFLRNKKKGFVLCCGHLTLRWKLSTFLSVPIFSPVFTFRVSSKTQICTVTRKFEHLSLCTDLRLERSVQKERGVFYIVFKLNPCMRAKVSLNHYCTVLLCAAVLKEDL